MLSSIELPTLQSATPSGGHDPTGSNKGKQQILDIQGGFLKAKGDPHRAHGSL